MTTQPLIEAKDIVNRFGSQVVHDGVDMCLREGKIMGLVGGSGSGKSVLLRTILGLNRPKRGRVLVKGQDVYALPDDEKKELQKTWGVVFQDGALFSGLNVLDNVAVPVREHSQLNEDETEDLCMFKLQMVGLEPEAALKFPAELSGGMGRRAALARALALDPEVLFLDEPTGALDPVSAAAFDDLILSLRDILKLSVLIITHDIDTLVTICDCIAMIADKKLESGTLEEMLHSDNPSIKKFFGGRRMQDLLKGKQDKR